MDSRQKATADALAFYGVKTADVVTPLQPHQQRVIDKLKASHGLLVAHGVGSGKTLTSIAAGDALGLPVDAVVPAPLIANYDKELDKHLDHRPDNIRIRSYEKAVRDGSVHQDGLVVMDEAHRARNSGTNLAQIIGKQTQTAKARMLLTGTPVYNQPSDVANLLNTAAGKELLPSDPNMFKRQYVGTRTIEPGFWNKLRGMKPMTEPVLKNRADLVRAATGYVDVHKGGGDHFPDRVDEEYDVPMSGRQHDIYRFHEGKMPWYLKAKVRAGLPMTKSESQELNAFQGALRQASNTPRPYIEKMTDEQEERDMPKVRQMADHLVEMLKKDPQYRGVVYSNYLDGGLLPMSRMLNKANVNHRVFHGGVSKLERAQMVKDYNEGKVPALLVSSSGAEGLDLKGTRSVQVMEPHWNDSKIEQVIGRGIRYKSHDHLPEDQRKVRVMRYYASPPKGLLDRMHVTTPDKGIERYLQGTSKTKSELAEQIMDALQEASDNGPLRPQPTAPELVNWRDQGK